MKSDSAKQNLLSLLFRAKDLGSDLQTMKNLYVMGANKGSELIRIEDELESAKASIDHTDMQK